MTCPTRSGSYQCKHPLNHAGDCEADDASRFVLGPYRDADRGRAYLRGRLDQAVGAALDELVRDLPRETGEDDATYRARVWRAVS